MENSIHKSMRLHTPSRTESSETVDRFPCLFAVLHHHGLMSLIVSIRQGFRRCLPLKLRMEPSITVQFSFLGYSARKQLLNISAFQYSSLYNDVINLIHGALY